MLKTTKKLNSILDVMFEKDYERYRLEFGTLVHNMACDSVGGMESRDAEAKAALAQHYYAFMEAYIHARMAESSGRTKTRSCYVQHVIPNKDRELTVENFKRWRK